MLKTLFLDLFQFRAGHGARRLALLALVLVLLSVPGRRFLQPGPTTLMDGHAVAAIELAMTRSFCGRPSAFPPMYRVPHYLRDHPEQQDLPLRQVAASLAGSMAHYCESVTQPFINNENSLTLIMYWMLSIEPALSLNDMARRLHLVQLALVVWFSAVLVVYGVSVSVAAGIVWVGAGVLRTMAEFTHSLYPFMFPLLLTAITIHAITWRWLASGQWPRLVAIAAATGAFAGLGANLRTSHLPVYVMMTVVSLLFAWTAWGRGGLASRGGRAARAALVLAIFSASFWLFQYGLIDRYLPPNFAYNSSYHTVAHPLVLSLAVPESDLSRREGIAWEDAAGERLARRMIPTATYLGPDYDTALFRYYRHLWTAYPGDMAQLYLRKFSNAGVPIIDAFRRRGGMEGRASRLLLTPLAFLRSGLLLLAFCGGAVFLCWRWSASWPSPFPLVVALMSASAGLLLIESAIIMPAYQPQYHSYLSVYFMAISLLGVQALFQVAAAIAVGPSRDHSPRKTEQYFDAIVGDFAARMNPFDLAARVAWFEQAFAHQPPGARVLDVGAGLGHFSAAAQARGSAVVPLDIAPRLAVALKNRFVQSTCGSAMTLPFADGTFDSVISSECIEHTPDPVVAVQEMFRVLKPGGRLYLTTPNLVWRWSVWVAERLGVRNFEGIENWLSREQLRQAIVQAGGAIEVDQGLHLFPFQLRPLWPVLAWFNRHGQGLRAVMINQCWVARK